MAKSRAKRPTKKQAQVVNELKKLTLQEEVKAWGNFDVTPMKKEKLPDAASGEFAVEFRPNWSKRYTKETVEKDLHHFEYRGPGWYFTQTDTILITPFDENTFHVHCWNQTAVGSVADGNPVAVINWIVNAPTRLDTRKR